MSFSDEVRREICTSITDKNMRFACFYGMILFSRKLTEKHILFQSKSIICAKTFSNLFEKVFHEKIICKESHGKNNSVIYTYDIKSAETIEKIFRKYGISGNERHINYDIISTSSLGVFVAGAFLACGSVNDPEKEYHLEFTVADEQLANELIVLLGDIGVTARLALRRRQHIVYIKGSESIEDTLTFIGASKCTLDIINVKIYKDIRNKANRIANCDSANIDKMVNASMKQIKDISIIKEKKGLDSLPDDLQEIAHLRLENPTMSLRDICENLSEPISRSGVNHRFQRIAKIADDIRKAVKNNES